MRTVPFEVIGGVPVSTSASDDTLRGLGAARASAATGQARSMESERLIGSAHQDRMRTISASTSPIPTTFTSDT